MTQRAQQAILAGKKKKKHDGHDQVKLAQNLANQQYFQGTD